ncbi:MAG: glycosyltransferase family 39 protein [Candidatus Aenigmarchaeota archaeon]|nr:glycosyltransferase family 39 protein [Candidatus Aenigmarchaeota archaeon]
MKTRDKKYLLILITLLIGFFLRSIILWQNIEILIQKILIDDAFIAFSIAKNIANKNLVSFDGVSITNGFQPLWVFIIAPLFKIIQNDSVIHLVLTASAMLDTLTIFLMYRIGRIIYNHKVGILCSIIYAINPLFIFFTLNGIEVSLTIFLINLSLLYLFSIKNFTFFKSILLGTILGLTILSRMDSVFLIIGSFAFVIIKFRKNASQIFKYIIIVVISIIIVISPWFIWNYINFETFLPSSGKAVYKLGHMICNVNKCNDAELINILVKNLSTGIFLIIYYFGPINITPINIILAISVVYFLVSSIKNKNIILLPQLTYVGFILLFYSLYMWRLDLRYFTASSSILLVTLCDGIFLFAEGLKNNKRLVASLIFAILLTQIIINGYKEWTRGYTPWQTMMYEGSLWIKNNTGKDVVVSSFNSGLIQYYSQRRTINLDGVINFEAIKSIENKNVTDYIKSKNSTYFLDAILDIKSDISDKNAGLWEVNLWTSYMGKNYENFLKIIKTEMREFETVSGDNMKVIFFIARVIN